MLFTIIHWTSHVMKLRVTSQNIPHKSCLPPAGGGLRPIEGNSMRRRVRSRPYKDLQAFITSKNWILEALFHVFRRYLAKYPFSMGMTGIFVTKAWIRVESCLSQPPLHSRVGRTWSASSKLIYSTHSLNSFHWKSSIGPKWPLGTPQMA